MTTPQQTRLEWLEMLLDEQKADLKSGYPNAQHHVTAITEAIAWVKEQS